MHIMELVSVKLFCQHPFASCLRNASILLSSLFSHTLKLSSGLCLALMSGTEFPTHISEEAELLPLLFLYVLIFTFLL